MRMGLVVCSLIIASGCSRPADDGPADVRHATTSGEAAGRLLLTKPDPAATPHLHNLWQLTDRIYSGGEPHGEQAFAELAELGVAVVVSVDGARPDVEAAKQHGLRYVHIPFGYDGITKEAGMALARVVRETEAAGQTVYFHCHHGKHRGPAAAAVACLAAEAADHAAAQSILATAGTSHDYAGLWRDVAAYTPPPAGAELPELVEEARVDSLVTAMSNLDRALDNLKECQASDWETPPDHPDLVPAREALIVKEGLHEAARNLADGYDEEFLTWLREAEAQAQALETHLNAGRTTPATRTLLNLDATCHKCHEVYRN